METKMVWMANLHDPEHQYGIESTFFFLTWSVLYSWSFHDLLPRAKLFWNRAHIQWEKSARRTSRCWPREPSSIQGAVKVSGDGADDDEEDDQTNQKIPCSIDFCVLFCFRSEEHVRGRLVNTCVWASVSFCSGMYCLRGIFVRQICLMPSQGLQIFLHDKIRVAEPR